MNNIIRKQDVDTVKYNYQLMMLVNIKIPVPKGLNIVNIVNLMYLWQSMTGI